MSIIETSIGLCCSGRAASSQDKLPSPGGDISITLLVPTNGAWLKLLWDNGFFIPSINKIGDVLPATVLYNTMFGAISPDQVTGFSEEAPGSSPSIYGILSGNNGFNINYWSSFKDQKTAYYFASQDSLNDHVAETFRSVQVCNSWIYFTNKVLIPSASGKIKDVEIIEIPENLPWESSSVEQAPVEAPAPESLQVQPDPDPESSIEDKECQIPDPSIISSNTFDDNTLVEDNKNSECNTTFAEAARNANLGILATAISQESIKSSLPDPSSPNTLFAPDDNAFISMLSDLGLSITDALSLGSKLTGVILYHIHPGEALSMEELRERQSLSTSLGEQINNQDKVSVQVLSDEASGISLAGLKPGNEAKIISNIQVCGTSVYVIDKVLVPAATVDELPDPGVPMKKIEYRGSIEGGILNAGMASAVGPLQFCNVTLSAAGKYLYTKTNAEGVFNFEAIPKCAIDTGILNIFRDDNQGTQCVDTVTKLPLAYDLTVNLNNMLGHENALLPTKEFPLLLNPLSTILASQYAGLGTRNGSTYDIDQVVSFLGFDSPEDIVLGMSGSGNITAPEDDNFLAMNSQALVTSLLGAQVVHKYSNASFESGTRSVNDIIASQLDDLVDLADPAEIQRILEEAITLETDLSGIVESNTLQTISATIAEVNGIIKRIVYGGSSDTENKEQKIVASVTLAQNEIAPGIQQVATGQMSLSDFTKEFSPEIIREKILGESIQVPIPVPDTPKQEASAAGISFFHLCTSSIVSICIMYDYFSTFVFDITSF